MLPENRPTDQESEEIGAPDNGAEKSGEGSEKGVSEVGAPQELPRSEESPSCTPEAQAIPPGAKAGDDQGGAFNQKNPKDTGNRPSKPTPASSHRISRQTFRAAFIASGGNVTLIKRALGCSEGNVLSRINADPELKAMYANGGAPLAPPNEIQVMNRSPKDLPESALGNGVELTDRIEDRDLEAYRRALRAYGVSDKRLDKIKSFNGVAKDWASHLSISLRVTHQSYDGQLHGLAELNDDIRERLKGTVMEDGSIRPLSPEAYSFLAKCSIECVKEAGRGAGTMMALTEAIVRMTTASKNGSGPAPRATAGWGPMKKVRPPENQSSSADD